MKTKTLYGAALPAVLALLVVGGATTDRPGEARLDELDTTRPAAAALQQHQAALEQFYEAVEAAQVRDFLDAVAAAEAEAAAAAAAQAEAAAASRPAASSASAPTGAGSFLECTRGIESNGDYGAVSSGGTYRGAYQFHQGTWDSTARDAGRHDLVGTDPASASSGDQDAMASHLYDGGRGASHWGGRCT